MGDKYWAHPHFNKMSAGVACCISLKKTGEKVFYVATCIMRNPEFKVSQKGRERCLQKQERQVHAWVIGETWFQSENPYHPSYGLTRLPNVDVVSYNPFVASYFYPMRQVTDDYGNEFRIPDPSREIITCEVAWMVGGECWVWSPQYKTHHVS